MRRIGHKEHTASLENGCAVSVKILIRSVLTDNEKFVITVPVNMAAFAKSLYQAIKSSDFAAAPL